MKNNQEITARATANGVGFTGLLTIVFIVLKLLGYITWSWIWVLSPLWISFALTMGIIILVLIIAAILAR